MRREAWRAFEAVKAEPQEPGYAGVKILSLRSSIHGAEQTAQVTGAAKKTQRQLIAFKERRYA